MNNTELIFYILGCLVFVVMGTLSLIKLIKEIRRIGITKHDNYVKAVVVNWRIFTTGDIFPTAMYMVEGVEKIYQFHFVHNRNDYPIGKEIYLQLSNSSGLAYDKKDLMQGFLMTLFGLFFFGCALVVGICYMIFAR